MRMPRKKSSILTALGVLVVPCIFIYLFVVIAASYRGECGGFVPGLSGGKPCSLLEWVFSYALSLAVIGTVVFVVEHWLAVLLLTATLLSLGWWLRRSGL